MWFREQRRFCSVLMSIFRNVFFTDARLYSCGTMMMIQSSRNDLAVLRLASDSSATPITVNSNTGYPSISGTALTVMGFGRTSTGGSVSSVLKKVGTAFVDYATCRIPWGSLVTSDLHVCARAPTTGEGACNGMSVVRLSYFSLLTVEASSTISRLHLSHTSTSLFGLP